MQIYLPIAEMSVPAGSIMALGAIVGFLSGLFGVGGGFLTTPFLIFQGIPPAIAVGTQTNQLLATSVSSVLGHLRKGNVDLRMGTVMLCGGLLGSVVGVGIFRLLQYFGQIDFAIAILYVVLLGSIGSMMLFESLRSVVVQRRKTFKTEFNNLKTDGWKQSLPYKMRFPQSRLYISALIPGSIGFVGGLMVMVMGIGGGFLLVPAMIYVIGMPALLVAGTSMFQIIFTTAFGTLLHAFVNHNVDLVLAAVLIIGSVIGAQVGVVFAKKIKGVWARLLLASIILSVALKLGANLLVEPGELYSLQVLS